MPPKIIRSEAFLTRWEINGEFKSVKNHLESITVQSVIETR